MTVSGSSTCPLPPPSSAPKVGLTPKVQACPFSGVRPGSPQAARPPTIDDFVKSRSHQPSQAHRPRDIQNLTERVETMPFQCPHEKLLKSTSLFIAVSGVNALEVERRSREAHPSELFGIPHNVPGPFSRSGVDLFLSFELSSDHAGCQEGSTLQTVWKLQPRLDASTLVLQAFCILLVRSCQALV